MTFRTTLAAAAALLALGAAPAFAQGGNGGDTNINNFVRQSPNGMQPQNNGVPVIVDNREGQPVIQYRGANPRAGGVQDGGVPRIVDNREGQPVIRYDGSSGPVRGARPPRNSRQMASRQAAAPMAMGPMLSGARTAIQRGQFGTASARLEAAETRLLNESGGAADNATLRGISEARAAANRRDRAGALRALDTATQSMNRAG